MSAAGISFNIPVWQNILNAAKSGLFGNIQATVANLTSDAVGLVGQEAADFDAGVTAFNNNISAGQSPSTAFSSAFGAYATAAKTDAWNALMKALSDGLNFLDGIAKSIEAAI